MGKKGNVILIAFVLILGFNVFGKIATDSTLIHSQIQLKDSLELEKIKLEISELRIKDERSTFNLFLSLIGGATGFITVLWTIYQGVKNYKTQLQQQKLSTISNLLVLLTDDASNKRVGAARGLGKYSNYVTDELIAAISVEKEDFVREAIEDALLTINEENQTKVIAANQETLKDLAKLMGELIAFKIAQTEIDVILKIDPEVRVHLVKDYRFLYDLGKRLARKKNYPTVTELPIEYLNKIERLNRTLESTGLVISRLFKNNQSLKLSKIDISYTEFYKQHIRNIEINGVYAISIICRHFRFENSTFRNSFFKSADMFDSTFDGSAIYGCNFKQADLRQSKGTNVIIENSVFSNDAVLSETNFNVLISKNNDFSYSKMKNFKTAGSNFENTKFNSSELQHSAFQNSTLLDCDFYGSKMAECNFNHSEFKNIKFNGADLRGSNFENAHLENVDFSGADLKNIKTNNWTTVNCNFEKSRNFNETIG